MDLSVALPGARDAGSNLIESGLLPDSVLRLGIRLLLARRLHGLTRGGHAAEAAFLEEMGRSPIALATDAANAQHYEVPAAFYSAVLGPHMKYSSAYFATGTETLGQAESAMLELTCERAGIANGQRILELGCGWGSLTLWMARRYRDSEIVAVSNSHGQRRLLEGRARQEGLSNLTIVTSDMNDFEPEGAFDRIVSVEMFEHMRNWSHLLRRVSSWLAPEGAVFLHVFSHRSFTYPFEDRGAGDWMARHFFTGGLMPSHDLLTRIDQPFELERSWVVPGTHYQKTADAWLDNLDQLRDAVWPTLEQTYGAQDAARWFQRWRLFFMACSELFGYRGGREWHVSHHRLRAKVPGSTR